MANQHYDFQQYQQDSQPSRYQRDDLPHQSYQGRGLHTSGGRSSEQPGHGNYQQPYQSTYEDQGYRPSGSYSHPDRPPIGDRSSSRSSDQQPSSHDYGRQPYQSAPEDQEYRHSGSYSQPDSPPIGDQSSSRSSGQQPSSHGYGRQPYQSAPEDQEYRPSGSYSQPDSPPIGDLSSSRSSGQQPSSHGYGRQPYQSAPEDQEYRHSGSYSQPDSPPIGDRSSSRSSGQQPSSQGYGRQPYQSAPEDQEYRPSGSYSQPDRPPIGDQSSSRSSDQQPSSHSYGRQRYQSAPEDEEYRPSGSYSQPDRPPIGDQSSSRSSGQQPSSHSYGRQRYQSAPEDEEYRSSGSYSQLNRPSYQQHQPYTEDQEYRLSNESSGGPAYQRTSGYNQQTYHRSGHPTRPTDYHDTTCSTERPLYSEGVGPERDRKERQIGTRGHIPDEKEHQASDDDDTSGDEDEDAQGYRMSIGNLADIPNGVVMSHFAPYGACNVTRKRYNEPVGLIYFKSKELAEKAYNDGEPKIVNGQMCTTQVLKGTNPPCWITLELVKQAEKKYLSSDGEDDYSSGDEIDDATHNTTQRNWPQGYRMKMNELMGIADDDIMAHFAAYGARHLWHKKERGFIYFISKQEAEAAYYAGKDDVVKGKKVTRHNLTGTYPPRSIVMEEPVEISQDMADKTETFTQKKKKSIMGLPGFFLSMQHTKDVPHQKILDYFSRYGTPAIFHREKDHKNAYLNYPKSDMANAAYEGGEIIQTNVRHAVSSHCIAGRYITVEYLFGLQTSVVNEKLGKWVKKAAYGYDEQQRPFHHGSNLQNQAPSYTQPATGNTPDNQQVQPKTHPVNDHHTTNKPDKQQVHPQTKPLDDQATTNTPNNKEVRPQTHPVDDHPTTNTPDKQQVQPNTNPIDDHHTTKPGGGDKGPVEDRKSQQISVPGPSGIGTGPVQKEHYAPDYGDDDYEDDAPPGGRPPPGYRMRMNNIKGVSDKAIMFHFERWGVSHISHKKSSHARGFIYFHTKQHAERAYSAGHHDVYKGKKVSRHVLEGVNPPRSMMIEHHVQIYQELQNADRKKQNRLASGLPMQKIKAPREKRQMSVKGLQGFLMKMQNIQGVPYEKILYHFRMYGTPAIYHSKNDDATAYLSFPKRKMALAAYDGGKKGQISELHSNSTHCISGKNITLEFLQEMLTKGHFVHMVKKE